MHAFALRLLASLALLACIGISPRTTDTFAYLQVPGVTGPVVSTGFTGAIELLSSSLQYVGVGGITVLKPSPLTFTKNVDTTSPVFQKAFLSGQPFTGDTLLGFYARDPRTGKMSQIEQVKFHNVVVTSDSTGVSIESISLTYDAIDACVTPASKGGPPDCAAWDFTKHTPTYPK